MSFTHLHVASGYSMQYGASSPAALVQRAAELGLPRMALTDRDGLYGAVKFVSAASAAGIAPILGVDLAVQASGLLAGLPAWADPAAAAAASLARGAPVRGGGVVDPRHARVVVLAHSSRSGSARVDTDRGRVAPGWSALCRLVSGTHLRADRGEPVATTGLIAAHAAAEHLPGESRPGDPGALTVLLGPSSELGRAVLARRLDLARAVLAHWYDAVPLGALAIEVVCHDGPASSPASLAHAARMLGFAREVGMPAVLTMAVRYATPEGAATADLLDAARRLVPLGTRHLDRTTSAGYLTSVTQMAQLAERIVTAAGLGAQAVTDLLGETERLADRCQLDPGTDLGIGEVHLPEPWVVTRGVATSTHQADVELRRRCEAAVDRRYPGASPSRLAVVRDRLNEELATIAGLGYPTYFLTVAEVCQLIRERGVRVAARGSGAGSLVNHLLGISGVEPIDLGLLMERFCTPLRAELPDIDIDVESARRTEIYEWILDRFGGQRVSCVSMMDTYRVRHAIRDVGAALGLPPSEIDTIATAFPHIRARDVRSALAELPELGRSGLTAPRYRLLFDLVERLDGLPRHIAVHPCGVLLGNAGLLDRTPVEASWQGFPMSQFDKDDVEVLGLLKLDVLGIRMQSAMAHAVSEVTRVDGAQAVTAGNHPGWATQEVGYLDPQTGEIELDAVPLDDETTFRLIRSAHTLGCFQIESPGQRELVGKFAPQNFTDLIIDISLFRPGPVKSDMITPFLRARQGWSQASYLHESLIAALEETRGVVVFHEQVIRIVGEVAGVPLDRADEVRRSMGSTDGQQEVQAWLRPRAAERGYTEDEIDQIWAVLTAFASFGFCKAHAAAFALPTYQSAWLKAHHPAAFLAGVLTHDPGMYPKRLILDDARNLGISVLGLDVNRSQGEYRVELLEGESDPVRGELADPERVPVSERAPKPTPAPAPGSEPAPEPEPEPEPPAPEPAGQDESGRHERTLHPMQAVTDSEQMRYDSWVPDGSGYGIRLALSDVKGISAAEVNRIVAGQPYVSLADFWHRARASRPIVENLVLAGAFDSLYGLGAGLSVRPRGRPTHRDLLLQVADLDRWSRSVLGSRTARGRNRPTSVVVGDGSTVMGDEVVHLDPSSAAARQSQAAAPVPHASHLQVQTALDLADAPEQATPSGLPEFTAAERVRAELEILGLDASSHLVRFYLPMLRDLGVVPSRTLLAQRSRSELLVAGVKVATQTPPIRSGRRVVFLTLDDSTGPVDATFFEDVQGPYAATVFGSWLLLVRGELRRTGPRGASLRATGAWDLSVLWETWCSGGRQAVRGLMEPVEEVLTRPRRDDPGRVRQASSAPTAVFQRDEGPARVYGVERDDGHTRGPVDAQGPEEERAAAARLRQLIAARAGDPPVDPPVWPDAPGRSGSPSRSEPSRSEPSRSGQSQPEPVAAQPGRRRVLVHASGFRQSPYADLQPPGGDVRSTRTQASGRPAPRALWHASPGSSGR
ncbi:MAG: PHP domain-containing protein [Actinomycetales bacterium]